MHGEVKVTLLVVATDARNISYLFVRIISLRYICSKIITYFLMILFTIITTIALLLLTFIERPI